MARVDRSGNIVPTELTDRLIEGYRGEGISLVSFDPWNLFGPGERFVNDAEAMLVSEGARLSQEFGACVRFTGHVSKEVGRRAIIDAHSGRGGASMGDNSRFVFSYVQHDPRHDREWAPPMDAADAAARGELFRLHNTKQSYAKRQPEPIWIVRDGYRFEVVEGPPGDSSQAAAETRVKAFVQQELEAGVKYSKTELIEQRERYGLSRDNARAVAGRLLAMEEGGLCEVELPQEERRTRRTHYLMPHWVEDEPFDSETPVFEEPAAVASSEEAEKPEEKPSAEGGSPTAKSGSERPRATLV